MHSYTYLNSKNNSLGAWKRVVSIVFSEKGLGMLFFQSEIGEFKNTLLKNSLMIFEDQLMMSYYIYLNLTYRSWRGIKHEVKFSN